MSQELRQGLATGKEGRSGEAHTKPSGSRVVVQNLPSGFSKCFGPELAQYLYFSHIGLYI